MLLRRAFAGLVLTLCLVLPAMDVSAQLTDATGSKDHPMIKRFEGSAIIGYGRSPLEVMRNYEREPQRIGFQALFKCAREECSKQDGALGWMYLYPPKRRLQNTLTFRALSYATDQHFVKDLTTRHGIPATRLKAAGSGPLAPVAPNETDEGRGKNRRVELVKQ